MSKSCGTTLFVLEWPKTFSSNSVLWNWKITKQEMPYRVKYWHVSVLFSVTFILQKRTILWLLILTQQWIISHSCCVFSGLTGIFPEHTQGLISTQGIGHTENMISCLSFCTWGRRWHLSLPLRSFHLTPTACQGLAKCDLNVPARKEVCNFDEPAERHSWFTHSLCLKQEVS